MKLTNSMRKLLCNVQKYGYSCEVGMKNREWNKAHVAVFRYGLVVMDGLKTRITDAGFKAMKSK